MDFSSKSIRNWHSDDENLFDAQRSPSLIISFSLGETRLFEIMPSPDHSDWVKYNHPTQVYLKSGDILTMNGFFQKFFWHRAPPNREDCGSRINFTWRWIKSHTRKCPLNVLSSRSDDLDSNCVEESISEEKTDGLDDSFEDKDGTHLLFVVARSHESR